jgi:hypothetical protein
VIVVELDGLFQSKDQTVRDLLLARGFVNAVARYGSIRDACLPGGDYTLNEVYFHQEFCTPDVPPLRDRRALLTLSAFCFHQVLVRLRNVKDIRLVGGKQHDGKRKRVTG